MAEAVCETGTKRSSVQEGGICASKDGCQNVQKSCFFACLDILGFKNVVKHHSYEQLKKIVAAFISESVRAIDASRCIKCRDPKTSKESVDSRIKLASRIKARIVSDSIYIWTENDNRLKQFDCLLHVVNAMLACGFEQRLPLRGVVTFGEIFLDEVKVPDDVPKDLEDVFSGNGSVVYGKALVEAHELEGRMEWSGAILTPKAWETVVKEFEKSDGPGAGTVMFAENIKRAEDLFNHYPYLIWYDVPFKKGSTEVIAYNWNYKPYLNISAEKIYNAFTGRCDTDDATVALKRRNTLEFYERIKLFAKPCNKESVEVMPVPDSDYASRDLLNN